MYHSVTEVSFSVILPAFSLLSVQSSLMIRVNRGTKPINCKTLLTPKFMSCKSGFSWRNLVLHDAKNNSETDDKEKGT